MVIGKMKNWFDEECNKVPKLRNQACQRMRQYPSDKNAQKYRQVRTNARRILKVKKIATEVELLKNYKQMKSITKPENSSKK